MNLKAETAAIALLVILLLAVAKVGWDFRERVISLERNIGAMADTLETSRDELGRQTAEIESLEVESSTQFLSLRSRDVTINRLQNLVSEYKGKVSAAASATTETSMIGSGVPEVGQRSDTVLRGDTILIYETYTRVWRSPWESGKIVANRDSVTHSIQVKDSLDVVIGKPRNWNPFKRSKPEVILKSANPNVSITNLRSVDVVGGDKRLGFGVYAGYGITASPDGSLGHGIQLGLGGTWRIYP